MSVSGALTAWAEWCLLTPRCREVARRVTRTASIVELALTPTVKAAYTFPAGRRTGSPGYGTRVVYYRRCTERTTRRTGRQWRRVPRASVVEEIQVVAALYALGDRRVTERLVQGTLAR